MNSLIAMALRRQASWPRWHGPCLRSSRSVSPSPIASKGQLMNDTASKPNVRRLQGR